jgi:hypothetical protein
MKKRTPPPTHPAHPFAESTDSSRGPANNPLDEAQEKGPEEKHLDIDLNKERILKAYNEYKELLDLKISTLSNDFTINNIENMLRETKNTFSSIVDDTLHDAITGIDENKLIRKKKQNTKTKV